MLRLPSARELSLVDGPVKSSRALTDLVQMNVRNGSKADVGCWTVAAHRRFRFAFANFASHKERICVGVSLNLGPGYFD